MEFTTVASTRIKKRQKKKNFLYYDEKKMTPKNSISHLSMQSLNALEYSLISNFLQKDVLIKNVNKQGHVTNEK